MRILIDEDTAVLAHPGRFEVLGRGSVTTVDAREVLGRGSVTTVGARAAGPAGLAPAHGHRACFDVRLHRLYAGDAFRLR